MPGEAILEVHRIGRAPHVSVHEATIDLALAEVELRIGRSTVTISRVASDPDRVELKINEGDGPRSITFHVLR